MGQNTHYYIRKEDFATNSESCFERQKNDRYREDNGR